MPSLYLLMVRQPLPPRVEKRHKGSSERYICQFKAGYEQIALISLSIIVIVIRIMSYFLSGSAGQSRALALAWVLRLPAFSWKADTGLMQQSRKQS